MVVVDSRGRDSAWLARLRILQVRYPPSLEGLPVRLCGGLYVTVPCAVQQASSLHACKNSF